MISTGNYYTANNLIAVLLILITALMRKIEY